MKSERWVQHEQVTGRLFSDASPQSAPRESEPALLREQTPVTELLHSAAEARLDEAEAK